MTGCREDRTLENATIPRLLVETRGVSYGAMGGEVITLPVSGTSIAVQKVPVVTEFDITNVEMVEVELGRALLVQVNEAGARALYRSTVTNMGGRIVLTVNGNAIGARRIDGAIADGNFYTFVEVDDEELGQLVLDIKETLAELEP
jgi:hypothetical protein